MSGTFQCPLCERDGDFLKPSKHHLVPKSWDGRVTADICADCHRQIHALFTLPELAREYDTLDKLRAAEPMQRWIKWAGRAGVESRSGPATPRRIAAK
jgi:5-methylcytosine-specific restriction protein A